MPTRRTILIVGASGRAAAASALRAGWRPFVIDLFADADTERLCPVLKCDPADYPRGFVGLAERAPPGPWMYTGGLENHPGVVAAISASRELLGNGPEVLARVRDPHWVADAVRAADGRFPDTIPVGTIPPGDPSDRWLRKPLDSSGGARVRYAKSSDFDPASPNIRDCLQQFITGRPMSALFRREGGEAVLIGMTHQLVGTDWLHAPPFVYAGNITHEHADHRKWMTVHLQAYADWELRHCWGCDFMDLGTGMPWTIEVNPRYTAAVEVIEFATARAFLGTWTAPPPPVGRAVGKAIYYAAAGLNFPASGPWDDSLARCTDVWQRPDFADIPHPGTAIDTGQPVITLFAEAETEAGCLAGLQRRAAAMDELFGIGTPKGLHR